MEYRTKPRGFFWRFFFNFWCFFIYFSVKFSHTESENGACGVRRASRVRRRCVSGASVRLGCAGGFPPFSTACAPGLKNGPI